MIHSGCRIYVNPNTGKAYSKPGKARMFIGQYGLDNEKPMKEGAKLMISITKKGIVEAERLAKESP